MRASVRATQAVALLLGFYALGLGIVIGLVVMDVVGVKLIGPWGSAGIGVLVCCGPATLLAIAAIVRGVTVSTRVSAADLSGVAVTAEAEPTLWARVRLLAQAMDTRAPREILVGPEAEAAVWERGHLFGLLPGKRSLIIGAPLLLALSPAQLDAVLAHELGHYSNRDTRLGPLVCRGRLGIWTVLRAMERSVPLGGQPVPRRRFEPLGWWYLVLAVRRYAQLFFSMTEATSRGQELAADRAAARIAGRENIVSALAEIPTISSAYRCYLRDYALAGLPFLLLPEPDQVVGGFGSLIADPLRAEEFAQLRSRSAQERASRFDSHPPLSERLAVLRALPDDGRSPAGESGARAVEILHHRSAVLAEVGRRKLGSAAVGTSAVEWDGLADVVSFHRADQDAAPLVEAVAAVIGYAGPTPEALLDAVDAGRLADVRDRLEAPRPMPDAQDDFQRRLRAWILVRLAERGRVRWVVSWSNFAELEAPAGFPEALEAALAALLGREPQTAPLRRILSGAA